jgi:FkbM family methyltransferase
MNRLMYKILAMFCRLLPNFVERLCNKVFKQLLPREGVLQYPIYRGELDFQWDLRQDPARSNYFSGTNDRALTNYLRGTLKRGNTFVDVGTNIGMFAHQANELVGKQGRVVAVEPIPWLASALELRYRGEIEVHQVVISDASVGEVELKIPDDHLGYASINSEHIKRNQDRFTQYSTVSVNCVKLDELVDQVNLSYVDVLKIDVEGHELEVLRGGTRLLNRSIKAIVYECDYIDQEVGQFLAAYGFTSYYLEPRMLYGYKLCNKKTSARNVVAIRKINM